MRNRKDKRQAQEWGKFIVEVGRQNGKSTTPNSGTDAMGTFVNVTAAEVADLLRPEKGWKVSGEAHEYVYIFQIPFMPPGTILKVRTGINKHNDQSRKRGGDAMRVHVIDVPNDRCVVKMPHVKRTTNWRNNLEIRIREALTEARAKVTNEGAAINRELNKEKAQ